MDTVSAKSTQKSCILITGTSSGIGLASALELARSGHTVYATMRRPDLATAFRKTVGDESLPIKILAMDVNSDESVTSTIATIRAEAGFIDVLLNNAGLERIGSVEELPLADFRATMETNYFGALRCIQAVLPEMRAHKRGLIINMSSVVGQIACSPMTPYVASKAALEALSEALAQEVKPFNIRVAIVQPGVVDTPMARRIETPAHESLYPHTRRFAGMFAASLARPTLPSAVAEVVRHIVESGTWQLRHQASPDAGPFLQWRASMTDEEWVNWGALNDDAWYQRVQHDFGMDAHPQA